MTNYEIRFKEIVQFKQSFVLNIINVPISQIYEDFYEPHSVTVTIDPDWTEPDFGTLVDNTDSMWLFPLSLKDTVTKKLDDLGKIW